MATAILNDSSVSNNPIPAVDPNAPVGPILKIVNGRPVVSSLQVAEHFGKQHYNVLRSIEAIIRNSPESFGALNFEVTSYQVEMPNGGGFKDCPAYDLTRDGFVIVAMGFTGKKAITWKIAYVQAFNAMEAELARQHEADAPTGPMLSGTITPSQQQELKELVQAKASAYPDAVKRKVFSQIWMRLQRKFKVPRYEALPVAIFGEARDYVIAMQVHEIEIAGSADAPKALPKPQKTSTIQDYALFYGGLPDSPRYWTELSWRCFRAFEKFEAELKAIKEEAFRPFKENRKSDVTTFVDEAMSPTYSLFEVASAEIRTAYMSLYESFDGLKAVYAMLRHG